MGYLEKSPNQFTRDRHFGYLSRIDDRRKERYYRAYG